MTLVFFFLDTRKGTSYFRTKGYYFTEGRVTLSSNVGKLLLLSMHSTKRRGYLRAQLKVEFKQKVLF